VRYFLAVCQHGSFTAAAKACGVTQPSVTTGVRRLERAVGGRLFERRHPVRLTPFAMALRPLLERMDWLSKEINDLVAAHGETPRRRGSRVAEGDTRLFDQPPPGRTHLAAASPAGGREPPGGIRIATQNISGESTVGRAHDPGPSNGVPSTANSADSIPAIAAVAAPAGGHAVESRRRDRQ
jgi:DNA-binding transcriptional LysR family regulator